MSVNDALGFKASGDAHYEAQEYESAAEDYGKAIQKKLLQYKFKEENIQ